VLAAATLVLGHGNKQLQDMLKLSLEANLKVIQSALLEELMAERGKAQDEFAVKRKDLLSRGR